MWGRDYRKAISQAWAAIAVRWIAIWVAVASCAGYGRPGTAAAFVIVAIDITTSAQYRGTILLLTEMQRKDWLDRLTNRCFYKIFWEELRSQNGRYIDIDDLFKRASADALEDIGVANEKALFYDGTFWHIFGGFLHFVWLSVSLVLYYGSAMYFGAQAG